MPFNKCFDCIDADYCKEWHKLYPNAPYCSEKEPDKEDKKDERKRIP